MPKITVDRSLCVRCGQCSLICPCGNFRNHSGKDYPSVVSDAEVNCIACHHCLAACPGRALNIAGITCGDCLENDNSPVVRFEQIANLLRNRRSIRRYADKPVEERVIEQLLDVVRWAPSAKNGLPVNWVIINGTEKVKELAGIIINWFKTLPNTERMIEVWENGGDPIFRGAPCVIGAYTNVNSSYWSEMDTAIAVETLDMCAAAMRLGTCWAGLFIKAAQSEEKPAINHWLGLSDTETIFGGLMLGYIGEEKYQRVPFRPEAPKKWIR